MRNRMDVYLRNQIRKTIKEKIQEKGLTQIEIGKEIGVTKQCITMMLSERTNNMIPIDRVPNLCRVLGITPNELFGWQGETE